MPKTPEEMAIWKNAISRHQDFPALSKDDYLSLIDRLERKLSPTWHIEIGSRWGDSLETRECNIIAIDPMFQFRKPVINQKKLSFFSQTTSDEFFETGFLQSANIKP